MVATSAASVATVCPCVATVWALVDVVAAVSATANSAVAIVSASVIAVFAAWTSFSPTKFFPISAISLADSPNWKLKSFKLKDVKVFNKSILPDSCPKNSPTGPGNKDSDVNKSFDLALVFDKPSWTSPNLFDNNLNASGSDVLRNSAVNAFACCWRFSVLSIATSMALPLTSYIISIFFAAMLL